MSSEFFDPVIINTIIFYLIGLFLIFYIVKFRLLTLSGSLKETGHTIHIGIKLLLFIFCVLFTTIFFDYYRSPFLNFSPPISLLDSQVLFIIFFVFITCLLYYTSNSVLIEHGYELNWILKLTVIICSFILTIFFFNFTSFFDFGNTNQVADVEKLLLLIILAGILYLLLLKAMKLLMNNNRDFDREAKKSKYALFILLILICFTVFSYKTTSLVQANNQEILDGNYQFSPNLEKVVFHISNKNTGVGNLMVKDLQTGVTNRYSIGFGVPYLFYNSSLMYTYTFNEGITNVYSLNLNTGNVNTLYTYHYQADYWTKFFSPYLEITCKVINRTQSIETLRLENLLTQKVINVSLDVPSDFSLYNQGFSDYFERYAPFGVSQDLTKLVLYSPENNTYVYTLTNNTMAQLQSVQNESFPFFAYNYLFRFIPSDSSNQMFLQYNNEIYVYDLTNQQLNHIGTMPNKSVYYVNSKDQLLFTNSVYTYKDGKITLEKAFLNSQPNELDIMSYDATASNTTQEYVVYAPWLPDVEVEMQTLIFWLIIFGTIILAVQSIRYVNNENLVSIY